MADISNSRDFRQDLTAKIVHLVEEGVAPWQKPWNSDGITFSLPRNASTGKSYRGGNAVWLMAMAPNNDPRWCTYKQALAEGWQIKKGSKGTPIEFWMFDKEDTQVDPITGQDKIVKSKLPTPIVRYSTVFHASQIDGIPELSLPQSPEGWDAIEAAEKILNSSGAVIMHDQMDRAFYSPSSDEIHLPSKEGFNSALDYYEVALHELGHWTGHETRLNRDLTGRFGSESYAREELRAQMASLYLSAELGVPYHPERHAAYQASWIKVLKEDKNEIFKAAKDAEAIAEHVIGLSKDKIIENQPVTKKTLSVAEVQIIAEKFLADYHLTNKLELIVREREEDIYDENYCQFLRENGLRGNGSYQAHNNIIALASSTFNDDQQVIRTLRHEILGHYGLNHCDPIQKRVILEQIISARDDDGFKELWVDVDRGYPQLTVIERADEVFAFVAEHIKSDLVLQHAQNYPSIKNDGSPFTIKDLAVLTQSIENGIKAGLLVQQTFPQKDGDLFRLGNAKPDPLSRQAPSSKNSNSHNSSGFAANSTQPTMRESNKATAALSYLSSDDRETWVRMAMALKNGLGEEGFAIWNDWSMGSDRYRQQDAHDVWKSIRTSVTGISLATLYFEAKQYGFKPQEWRTQGSPSHIKDNTQIEAQSAREAAEAKALQEQYIKAANKAHNVLRIAKPIQPGDNPYLIKRGFSKTETLFGLQVRMFPREINANDLKQVLGYSPKSDGVPLSGRILIVPVVNDKGVSTLEFIDESGRKAALAGGKKSGAWFDPMANLPKDTNIPTVIVEGVATAMSIHGALNPKGEPQKAYVVAALSDTNLKNAAKALKTLRPNAPIIVGADSNSIQKAHDAALSVGGYFIYPEFEGVTKLGSKAPTDFNDLMVLKPQSFKQILNQSIASPHLAMAGKSWEESLLIAPKEGIENQSINISTFGAKIMDSQQTTTNSENSSSKKIGENITNAKELPVGLVDKLKTEYGTKTLITTARENGTYKGEIFDYQSHFVQRISNTAVIVHEKSQLELKGPVADANNRGKLDGWDVKIFYDGKKAAAYPHDVQKEHFDTVIKQLRINAHQQGKKELVPALDELASSTWAQNLNYRKQQSAKEYTSQPKKPESKVTQEAPQKRAR